VNKSANGRTRTARLAAIVSVACKWEFFCIGPSAQESVLNIDQSRA